MLKIIRSVFAPILSVTILTMGNALLITFTSLTLKMENHTVQTVGYISALYFFGLVIGAFFCNRLIERVGHIRAYTIFAAFASALVMTQAIFLEVWMWGIIRFFMGISIAGLFATIESWLVAKSTIETKGKVLSIYMIAFYLSTGLSQLLLNVADPSTIIPYALIVIFCAISIVPVSITRIQAPVIEEPSYLNIFKLFKMTPLGVIGCIMSGFILGAIYSLVPVFADELNFSFKQISFCSSVTILGGFVLQWPIGQFSDLFDRRKVLSLVGFGTAIISFIIFLNSVHSFAFLLILLAILGGFAFTIYPLSLSHGSDRVLPKYIVSASASFGLSFSLGAVIGPILGSYFMDFFGPKGLFIYIGLVGLSVGIYSFYRTFKAQGVLKEDKTRYRNVHQTSHVGSELYPNFEKRKNHTKQNSSHQPEKSPNGKDKIHENGHTRNKSAH